MSDITSTVGIDTWADEANPDRNYASTISVGVRTTAPTRRFGFLRPALSGPALYGRTVLLAELSGRIRNTEGNAQDITATVLTERLTTTAVDWDHQPAASGLLSSVAAVPAGNAPGDVVTLDVTAAVQAIADGASYYGWRLGSSDSVGLVFWSYDSGEPAWELSVTLSQSPEQPTQLRPDGGAVGSSAPVLAWDGDGDGVIPQAEFQVLVYDSEADVTANFDSGWVVSPDPEYDLAATAYVPLATPFWTVQTKSATGALSEVSDRASFTTTAKPTLVMDSPTGGVIGDPSPSVAAHLSSGTLTMWRAWVTSGDRSDVLYDTGNRTGALAFTIPTRSGGKPVLRDEQAAWLRIRAWDAVDRVAAVGDPTYTETWTAITWDDDVIPAPTALTVTPSAVGDPRMVWQWSHVETAEAYLLQVDGITMLRVDPADISIVAGVYTYTDQGQLAPLRTHNLTVRAVELSKRSPASNTVVHAHTAEGVWAIPLDGTDPAVFRGTAVENIVREDHVATYQLQDGSSVDIIYGRPGLKGNLDLTASGDDAFDTLDALDALVPDGTTVPVVQLVWGSRSIRARLTSPHHIPASEITPGNLLHRARFGFVEED